MEDIVLTNLETQQRISALLPHHPMFSYGGRLWQCRYRGVDYRIDFPIELICFEQIVGQETECEVVFLPVHAAVQSLEIVVVAPPSGTFCRQNTQSCHLITNLLQERLESRTVFETAAPGSLRVKFIRYNCQLNSIKNKTFFYSNQQPNNFTVII